VRIALVSEYYPPYISGGAEWSTQLLAQELAAQPQIEQVVVITPNHGAAIYEVASKLLVERFPFPFKLHKRRIHPYGLLANPLFYLYSAWQIVRLARKHRVDLLHVQNKQILVGAVWAARWARIPVVVTLRDVMLLCRFGMCLNRYNEQPHGCDLATYGRCVREYLPLYMPGIGPLRRALFWLMAGYHRLDSQLKGSRLRRADALVTISDKLGEIMRSRRVTPPRTLTIYNTIPENEAGAARERAEDGCCRIFFAGRLSWGKGAHLLIEALPTIAAALAPQRVELIVAGEGPLKKQLEGRASALGFGDVVRFVGAVAQSAIQGYYANADVVVVPSVVQEGFGRVALEALVAGTPVVASTHGGLPEIVEDGVTGYVVAPEPALLAEAIVKVLRAAPEFRRRVAAALPKLRAKFGSDVSARHLTLYRSLLEQRVEEQGAAGHGRH
jgi:glycosyltransferase involved in cell wall biosynthesis